MYDVIVVGAGPAGSTAARYAAKAGLNTLLLEKEKLPRIKVCGGGLSMQAVSHLDLDIPEELIEKRCFGVKVRYGDISIESESDDCLALMLSRDKFDNYLAECAVASGAELMENVSVKSVALNDDHVLVETTAGIFMSNSLIGADGVHSVCAKAVRPDFNSDDLGFLLEAEIPVSDDFIDDYVSNKCEFHFGDVRNGYGWVFPKAGHLSVGIGGIGSVVTEPMAIYAHYIEKLGFNHVKPRGCFLPIGGMKRKTYSDRILLAGDAAGYVDAFLGEGMLYAIRSGTIAAEVVVDAHEKNVFSENFLLSYQTRCENDFGSNLKYSLIFSKLFHKYPNLSAKLLASNEPLVNKFIHLPTGKLGYLAFMKWLAPRLPYYALKSSMGGK